MTVTTTIDRQYFPGDGANLNFPFNFKFFDDSQIVVTLISPAPASTSVVQVLNSNYTLTGEGDNSGGQVTMLVAPPVNYTLLVQRVLPVVQPVSIRNQGKFFPQIHENVFDYLTFLVQQAMASVNNSLQLDPSGNMWDFEGKRGINAANPINAQDVATKNSVEAYVAAVLASGMGNMNLAQNVAYSPPDGVATVVSLALDRIVRVESFASMRTLVRADLVYLADWQGGWNVRANPTPKGGGWFKWSPTSVVADNGGTVCKLASVVTGRLIRVIEDHPTIPTWFGALMDGVTDDVVAVNNSITWAQNNGERWHLPAGTAKCTTAVLQTNRLHVTGEGRGVSNILRTGAGNAWTVTAPAAGAKSRFWKWEGISIIPDVAKTVNYAMQITLPTGSFMSNFDITDMEFGDFGRGLYLDNSAANTDGFFTGVINRCWIQNGLLGSVVGDSMTIRDNTITGNNCGIEIIGIAGARQMIIRNNNITTRGGAIALILVDQAKIEHNQIEHPGYLGNYTGIYGAQVYLASCFKTTLYGNTINPNNGAAIYAPGTIVCDGTTSHTVIDDNDIQQGSVFHYIFAATTSYHDVRRSNRYYLASGPVFDDSAVGTRGLIKPLPLVNGWIQHAVTEPAPSYYLDSDGFVNMIGIVKGGSGPLCTMPVGARPTGDREFCTVGPANTTPTAIQVTAVGTVTPNSATNTKIGLDGVRYQAQ